MAWAMKSRAAIFSGYRVEGFTLAELVLIVALTFILTGIGIPLVTNSLSGLQVAADARQMASSLSYAKMAAVSEMTRYQLAFNIYGNSWRLQKFNRTTGSYDDAGSSTHLAGWNSGSGSQLQWNSSSSPSGFPTDSSSLIRFNARGMPVTLGGGAAGNQTVYLSSGGTRYAVTVSLVGKVQVWKIQNSQWVSQ